METNSLTDELLTADDIVAMGVELVDIGHATEYPDIVGEADEEGSA